MHPFRSFSNDSYARESSFTPGWAPLERSVSPFGIDGLSPQADAVVQNVETQGTRPLVQSPIGMENNIPQEFTNRGESAPAHIRNIFSPSERSEGLLKALAIPSPPNATSEQELTDEEFDFSPTTAMSEHEEFLLGMGGMEDVGPTGTDFSSQPSSRVKNQPRNMSYTNNQPFNPRRPPSHSFGNVNSYNRLQMHPQQAQPNYGYHHDGHHNANFSPFEHFSHSPGFTPPRSEPTSHSYDSQPYSNFQLNQQAPRSPTNRPISVSKPLGYRTLGTNQFSHTRDQSPPSNFEESLPAQTTQWGEHPFGEHPSRTLFVRNINSNVEESELKEMFEEHGDIRSMYTSCKHRGFVMISYYDIRHAKTAMRSLQGRNLRRRKLDIHYSIPKENPPEKDQNQGTLVVFNLDPAITKEELRDIFGVHGEIKEIRETPNKRHHKFIEFYDVRCAEQAMKLLNKTEIKSKKIKIEPSRPGGRKPQNSSSSSSYNSRDDNSLSHSPDGNSFVSEFSNISKSAPSQPNQIFPGSNNPNSVIGDNFTLQRRRIPEQAQQSAWPAATNSTVATVQNHRPLRSISLPPGGNAPVGNSNAISVSANGTHNTSSERRTRGDDKRQFTLNILAVQEGIDRRTTLMIKNIPNKYTQKMLLSTVDETHKGLYDFFYLPIDFKNKCNVGYAFINFIDPKSIVSFYQQLHNTKWEKFNSEKVCNIAYARIQGKDSLIAHFQNSSLMSEDKKCRPIIFHSTGPKMGQQAPFPVGSNVRSRSKEEKRGQTTGDRINATSKRRLRSISCK